MSESDICIKLQFFITKYSQNQPLILLFHSASAEISYFEIMGIDLHGYPTRIPQRLLDGCSASNRKESIVLDTQRLWKSFIKGTDEDVKDPVTALNKVCRKLRLPTKHLHNAGKQNEAFRAQWSDLMTPSGCPQATTRSTLCRSS